MYPRKKLMNISMLKTLINLTMIFQPVYICHKLHVPMKHTQEKIFWKYGVEVRINFYSV